MIKCKFAQEYTKDGITDNIGEDVEVISFDFTNNIAKILFRKKIEECSLDYIDCSGILSNIDSVVSFYQRMILEIVFDDEKCVQFTTIFQNRNTDELFNFMSETFPNINKNFLQKILDIMLPIEYYPLRDILTNGMRIKVDYLPKQFLNGSVENLKKYIEETLPKYKQVEYHSKYFVATMSNHLAQIK